jgi:signal transduction histidine kinase
VLELRHVLARVARGRHDLNNPLTSAMAETQLALMDAKDPEIRAGLETIEEQLRRMRDLIASLRSIRTPD